MAVIASFSHNFVIGCLFGSFSVMMLSVEQRLGVSREMSSLGVSVVSAANGILAPVVGALAARYSLRLLFTIGAILSVLGYALLAATQSYALFLVAFGLLLAPGMALSAVVLPSTLVTRWFESNRGRVLGLVHVPVVVSIVPIVTSILLAQHGAPFTYAMFALVIGVIIVPMSLAVIDWPPGASPGVATPGASQGASADGATVWQILSSLRFWAIAIVCGVMIAGIVAINTHMVPMAEQWGISPTKAAILASVCALAGIPGSIFWGWFADKIGGARALTVAAIGCAILWSILLTNPSYAIALPVIGLIGIHGTASMPLGMMALSQTFGAASFSRAWGLSTMLSLPFTVFGVQSASTIFVRTGSYMTLFIIFIVAFLVTAPLPFFARQKQAAAVA